MQMCVNLWGYLYCLINQNDVRLYRDDGLIVVKNLKGNKQKDQGKTSFKYLKILTLKLKSKRIQLNLTFSISLLAYSKGHFDRTKSQITISAT